MSSLHLRQGTKVYTIDGTPVLLDQEIGAGGEGSVWSLQSDATLAAKFYYKGISREHAQKLAVMCRLKSDGLLKVAAWPVSTLQVDRNGSPEGLLMPRVTGHQAAHLLYSPKSRRTSFPEAQFPFIVHAAMNVASAFATVHEAGQVIGDVNHGNLLVSERATVALIDCDSFEITDQKEVYPCLVGVPTYTPPELQGKNFHGIRRTEQHDAFGLAVLIFHLLFLGRHPFAGIYKNGIADMTIEQAIGEYRFAYFSNSDSTDTQPPPAAPRLADVPPPLSDLFVRAFTRAGLNARRPLACEWIAPLKNLSKNMRQCIANSSHHFSNHLVACPWCRVERMVGIPMFGIKIVIVGAEQFHLAEIWAQIETLLVPPEPCPIPTSRDFIGSVVVDVTIGEIVRDRRAKRLMSACALALDIAIVFATQDSFILSIVILIAGLLVVAKLWRWNQPAIEKFEKVSEAAKEDYNSQIQTWERIQAAPVAFEEMKKSVTAARQRFNDLPVMRARMLAELNASRRQKQLRQFLESRRLEDAGLPGIGKGRIALLQAYNIEDAYDVEPSKISDLKGVGPTIRATLLAWRAMVEQQFQFDPSRSLDPREVRALEQELNQRRAEAINILKSAPPVLQGILNSWRGQRSFVLENLNRSAKSLAQAGADTKALRRW